MAVLQEVSYIPGVWKIHDIILNIKGLRVKNIATVGDSLFAG
jgi:hypothetical protein